MLTVRSTYHRDSERRLGLPDDLLANWGSHDLQSVVLAGVLAATLTLCVLLLCASSAGAARAGAAAGASSAATLVIDGAGDGHGVGMSQEGALGYAEHGWPSTAILATG